MNKRRGGQRPNAGAKIKTPDEKKEPVTIYVKKSSIKRHGGKNSLKEWLTRAAESQSFTEITGDKITEIIYPKTREAVISKKELPAAPKSPVEIKDKPPSFDIDNMFDEELKKIKNK